MDHGPDSRLPGPSTSELHNNPSSDLLSLEEPQHSLRPHSQSKGRGSSCIEEEHHAAAFATREDVFPNLSDARVEVESDTPERPLTAPSRPMWNGKLFALKNSRSKWKNVDTGHLGGRMYDYEQKYGPDERGQEMASEARFYRTYNDECGITDMERMDAWRDVLDVLLVFIGLFSAIVTTFVVQTSQALQPDYGKVTAVMVYNLILVQQAIANGSMTSMPAIMDPADVQAAPSSLEKWVNGLWFTSLGISLSTALVTVLTKQWLYHYMAQTSGTPQERARLRQFRVAGLEKYRVAMIIDLLPVALHVALALFLAGLSIFLSSLNVPITVTVSAISSIAYIAYTISSILPLYDPQCPYQSPISDYIHPIKTILAAVALQVRQRARKLGPPFAVLSPPPAKGFFERFVQVKTWASPISSLQKLENNAVLAQSAQLDIDAILWLYSASSNATVQSITSHAFAASLMPPDDLSPVSFNLSAFITPGLQCDACLPIAGWHTLLRMLAQWELHPVTVTQLLNLPRTTRRVRHLGDSPVTLGVAVLHNFAVESLVLDTLTKHLGVPRNTVRSLHSSSLLAAVEAWGLAHLQDTNTTTVWGESPRNTAFALVAASLGCWELMRYNDSAQLRNICQCLLAGIVRPMSFDMSAFLPKGPYCAIRLPQLAWRICLELLADLELNPVMVTRLLDIDNENPFMVTRLLDGEKDLPQSNPYARMGRFHISASDTFGNVLRKTNSFHSFVLDTVANRLGVPRDLVVSFHSPPLLAAIEVWALSHLDDTDQSQLWGETPKATALELIAACHKYTPWLRDHYLESQPELRNSLSGPSPADISHRLDDIALVNPSLLGPSSAGTTNVDSIQITPRKLEEAAERTNGVTELLQNRRQIVVADGVGNHEWSDFKETF